MARNPAVRKAAKATKRKAVVAGKRQQEVAARTPAARIQQAAKMPVLKCLLAPNLFEAGIGAAVLIRGVSREEQHVGTFMLDTFCLGVKDSFFRVLDRQDADAMMASLQAADAVEPVDPSEVRKLLHDLVAWAGANGFPPHKHYVLIETLFGDVVPADTDFTPRFGRDGKVVYMPGPLETAAEIRRRTVMVQSRFGAAAVDMGVLSFGHMIEDDDDDVVDVELVPEND
jgi:hypothetical protein